MEQQQPKTGKFALNYGLLLGVISVVFGVMLYTQKMHYETNTTVIVISIVIMAAIVFMAVNAFKKANGGYLTISEALKVAVGLALIGTIITLAYQFVLTNFIEPDFMDKAMEIAKPKAMEQNPSMTEEQWEQGMEMQKRFAWIQYPVILIMNCVIGLVLGLITGLILKKSKADY
ncbi:hypothetical protein Murru_0086 [Allomuricauda ruestringensis DSM 13258]|uniref:DUF4199 domain-containing protein n=1 Tax=Allomuricauda ruestringensis (strain DSM 13258 / CIP 107369 / LMG 19739 / B1) TaxID=886377 RepID=G2PQX9_ALLRU|nr:DUF4199 domain-containing protein [Allomuricauda ruestringensis]AEM69143.1 hypothetical protein Murru_0086 [Allomuricauda ruestringensis DSM 13258]